MRDRLAEQWSGWPTTRCAGEAWEKAVTYCGRPGRRRGALGVPRGGGLVRAGAGGAARLPETSRPTEQAIDLRLDIRTSLVPLGDRERILSHLGRPSASPRPRRPAPARAIAVAADPLPLGDWTNTTSRRGRDSAPSSSPPRSAIARRSVSANFVLGSDPTCARRLRAGDRALRRQIVAASLDGDCVRALRRARHPFGSSAVLARLVACRARAVRRSDCARRRGRARSPRRPITPSA